MKGQEDASKLVRSHSISRPLLAETQKNRSHDWFNLVPSLLVKLGLL